MALTDIVKITPDRRRYRLLLVHGVSKRGNGKATGKMGMYGVFAYHGAFQSVGGFRKPILVHT